MFNHGSKNCTVHEGFLGTYNFARVEVRSLVSSYLQKYPTATFHITGHSLGAALAIFAALDLKVDQGVDIASVMTVGQPRVGDAEFSTFTQDHLGNSNGRVAYYRITHYTDPVPHLPPISFNFEHPAPEVYYEQLKSLGSHKVCNATDGEDKTCSDKHLVDLNLLMHLSYVGFDFTSNYLACKL